MILSGRSRYSLGAMIFHWLIAIAVIVNWRLVENAHHVAKADHDWWMNNHKALGITILALTLLRVAWRLAHPAPPLHSSYAAWERMLARSLHVVFYILLIALPLGGWLATSFYGQGVNMWGLFTLPALPVGHNPGMGKEIFDVHGTVANIMLWLIGLHILGALKHTFWDKDGTLYRMLPFGGLKG